MPRQGHHGRAEGGHRGKGPPSDRREADRRIAEDINERLTDDPWLDPREIAVEVVDGRVTLVGIVAHLRDKERAQSLAESVSGVVSVLNNIEVVTQSGAALGLPPRP